ncbi:MAG: Acetoin:2,6-dichlorophenolindophenol oxidoreductase subunit beta [Elusimicrobia bacterium]|nr:Acetoin:2,6-dichlorophenolindophenol oxidoreductase subunit beta [Elusimicrobiota bacterium]
MERTLLYTEAVREATEIEMQRDPSVLVFGLGVDDAKGIQGTTTGLVEKFGVDRCFDTPLAEDGMTGVAIGMALAGLRPIHVHIRMDFVLLAMNQLVNMAAKLRYMYGGSVNVPMVVRAMIGKSWGQGPQHSQAFHSYFMHVPGIKVVAPSTPYDAKGCLIESIRDNNPVLFIEHRMLHFHKGPVPEGSYTVPFGRARVLMEGSDVTIVGISNMVYECIRAQKILAEAGLSAEIIDPISLSPLDMGTIVKSVKKTGHLLVVDNGWVTCGAGSEIVAHCLEMMRDDRHVKVQRMGFAPVTCPTTKVLEDCFYPNSRTIATAANTLVRPNHSWTPVDNNAQELIEFRGPF